MSNIDDLMKIYSELEKINNRINDLETKISSCNSSCEQESKLNKKSLFSFIKEKLSTIITFIIKL